jgi:hypothetical protein
MLDIFALPAALSLLALPGIFLWSALFPEQDWVERVTWGATTGLAMAVLCAFYAAQVRLSLFWTVWLGVAAICGTLAWTRRTNPRSVSGESASRWLLLVLAVAAVTRFAPTFVRDTPPGWDPSFHALLVKKLLLTDHMVRDWTPFAPIALNYPLGSHLLIAVLTRLTRLAPPRVFQLVIPAIGVLATAQVYGVARRVFQSTEVGVYAALAYGLWAFTGSIGYYAWGGLPNQLGMVFLMPVAALAAQRDWDWRSSVAMALFLASVAFTHHHVALVAGIMIAAIIIYLLLAPAVAEPRGRRKARGIALAIPLAAVPASGYIAVELARVLRIGETDALRFEEANSLYVFLAAGAILVGVAGAAGVALACRRENRGRSGMLLIISCALAMMFVLCGPVYRAYAMQRWHKEYVAFAASRFLTDLIYFLSIFAGFAVYQFARRARLTMRSGIAIGLLLGLTNLGLWKDAYRRDEQADRFEAYTWIEQHTSADAVVLNSDEWASYGTWRRTLLPPIPPTEPRRRDETPQRAAAALMQGHDPGGMTVVTVAAPGGQQRGVVKWKSRSGWSVVQLWPQ